MKTEESVHQASGSSLSHWPPSRKAAPQDAGRAMRRLQPCLALGVLEWEKQGQPRPCLSTREPLANAAVRRALGPFHDLIGKLRHLLAYLLNNTYCPPSKCQGTEIGTWKIKIR